MGSFARLQFSSLRCWLTILDIYFLKETSFSLFDTISISISILNLNKYTIGINLIRTLEPVFS